MGCLAARMTRPAVKTRRHRSSRTRAGRGRARLRQGFGGYCRKLCDLVRGSLPLLTGDRLLATDIAVATALLQTEVAQIHCLAQENDHEAD